MSISTICPKCGNQIKGVFQYNCPDCDFNISALAGRGTTEFQLAKWDKHSDLLEGRNIRLSDNQIFNTSFNFNGYAKLDNIVRFTITYGDRVELSSSRGNQVTPAIISYIPEQIGAGTAIHYPGTIPCSGICLVSPQSEIYAHSYPIIDEWVQNKFNKKYSFCRLCNSRTVFGQPICEDCYSKYGSDWINLLSLD